jgi:O-antigen/teichoic acid export membrane protein
LVHEAGVCLAAAWLSIREHGRPGISFRPELLWHAVRVGFPITLLWWVLILQGSVDRVVLGSLLGASAVGYFGFGLSLAGLLGLLPTVVARVLYPKVSKQFGVASDPDAMKALVLGPTLALAALMANLQLLLLASMPIIYNTVLPTENAALPRRRGTPFLDVREISSDAHKP